jgi:tetratricopeptide (TPR) repeat protein
MCVFKRVVFALTITLCFSGCVDGPKWERTMAEARRQMEAQQYAEAERSLLSAYDQANRLHRLHPYLLETDIELAQLYFKIGAYDREKAALTRAITRLEIVENEAHPGLAALYADLGRACDLLAQYDEARTHYLRALPVAEKRPAENELDYLYLDMAVNAARRKQIAEADAYFARATAVAQTLHPGGTIFEEIRAKRAEVGR